MSLNSSHSPPQDEPNDSPVKGMLIFWIIYIIMSVITFFVYIVCGAKSRSVAQVLVGVFLAGLWPILFLYVLVRKVTDKEYRFCSDPLVTVHTASPRKLSPRKSVRRQA